MFKRIVPLLALLLLAVPVTAAAKQLDVNGPATYAGKGAVQGRLASAEGPKRMQFRFVGALTFTGSPDDMVAVCRGNGQSHVSVQDGNLVVKCQGRGRMLAVVSSSALGFSGRALHYTIQVPEGVSGSIEGRQIRQVRPPPAEREQAPAER